jgi:hypothetical protein
LPISTQAQHERWQRAYTGDDFVVDVNPASLTFEPGHTFRVHFRTVFSKPETISPNSTTKYRTRLEIIEFKSTQKRYRYYETSLLDSAGTIVQNYPPNSSQDWKPFKDGGITERLFVAARSLSPLGRWKVLGYRYADGKPNEANEPRDLAKLNGTLVTLDVDAAQVGTQRCSSSAYQSRALTDKEVLRELGTSLDALGIMGTQTDTVILKCETGEWAPPQSLIIQLPSGDMLMLWKGVFLELRKQRY